MLIKEIKSLAIPEIKVIRYARFGDQRGYFSETFRKGDLRREERVSFLGGLEFLQGNESYSKAGTLRGMHFQWNPFMGKLVRTINGHMLDLVVDIRQGSPTLGKMIAYDMPCDLGADFSEWIWVPPGFAHGNCFPANTQIEYLCTGEYSKGCEAGICPFAPDIDWSLCDPKLKAVFDGFNCPDALINEKDRNGITLSAWLSGPNGGQFVYGRC